MKNSIQRQSQQTNVNTTLQLMPFQKFRDMPPWLPGGLFMVLGIVCIVSLYFAEICYPLSRAMGLTLAMISIIDLILWAAVTAAMAFGAAYFAIVKWMRVE